MSDFLAILLFVIVFVVGFYLIPMAVFVLGIEIVDWCNRKRKP